MRTGCCQSNQKCGNCGAPIGLHSYIHPHTRGGEGSICSGFIPAKMGKVEA